MEAVILELSQLGNSDDEIARLLTESGHSSPKNTQVVLPSTVKTIRLKHHIFQKRCQSHPRHIPGYLTIPQIAPKLSVTAHWFYHLIRSGKIKVSRDEQSGLYLFPDQPETLDLLQQLKAGTIKNLRF
jgi:predicted DNA-binding transcriptional regulator AlpA